MLLTGVRNGVGGLELGCFIDPCKEPTWDARLEPAFDPDPDGALEGGLEETRLGVLVWDPRKLCAGEMSLLPTLLIGVANCFIGVVICSTRDLLRGDSFTSNGSSNSIGSSVNKGVFSLIDLAGEGEGSFSISVLNGVTLTTSGFPIFVLSFFFFEAELCRDEWREDFFGVNIFFKGVSEVNPGFETIW